MPVAVLPRSGSSRVLPPKSPVIASIPRTVGEEGRAANSLQMVRIPPPKGSLPGTLHTRELAGFKPSRTHPRKPCSVLQYRETPVQRGAVSKTHVGARPRACGSSSGLASAHRFLERGR